MLKNPLLITCLNELIQLVELEKFMIDLLFFDFKEDK